MKFLRQFLVLIIILAVDDDIICFASYFDVFRWFRIFDCALCKEFVRIWIWLVEFYGYFLVEARSVQELESQ